MRWIYRPEATQK